MKRLVLMTALALVLAAPSAHAEYTGHGAISGRAPAPGDYTGHGAISSGAPSPATPGGQAASDAKSSVKDKWSKFKTDHAQTWQRLEDARAAHWHGISMHISKGNASPASAAESNGMTPEPGAEPSTQQGDNSQATDSGQRPSRWETFKENHQESVKEHLEAGKEKVKGAAADWKEKHPDPAGGVKDKVNEWKDNHRETIDAMKDKLHSWHERHSASQ